MEPQGWDALGAPQPASPAPAAAGLDKWPCRLQIRCLVGTCRMFFFDEAPSRQYAAPQLQLLLS